MRGGRNNAQERRRIDGIVAPPDLEMQVRRLCALAAGANRADRLAGADRIARLDIGAAQVRVTCFLAAGVVDLDNRTIAPAISGKADRAGRCRLDWCARRCEEIDASMESHFAVDRILTCTEAGADRAIDRHQEGRCGDGSCWRHVGGRRYQLLLGKGHLDAQRRHGQADQGREGDKGFRWCLAVMMVSSRILQVARSDRAGMVAGRPDAAVMVRSRVSA